MTLSARVWATWFVPQLPTRTVACVAFEDSGGPLECESRRLCFFLLLMIQLVDQPTSAEDTAVDIDRDSAAVDLLSDRNILFLHSLTWSSQGW